MSTKDAEAALATYAKKRDFSKTPEPSAANTKRPSVAKRARFVVQMHRASRLHYDFRLEADGVLKSWAIPKGPSFDTREKRLAMAVEDHPLDYRDFEGVIPAGNYGAGEVIVWDRGTYRLLEGTSTTEQIAKGSVKIEMFGEKLHGSFALVHIKGRGGEDNAWLLIKERDEAVDPSWRAEEHAQSVKTGKTLADYAHDLSAPHWNSSRPAAPAARQRARASEPVPAVASPMLATAIDEPFDDPDYFFELKWDGYRALATIDTDGTVAIASRNGNDFTQKFPELTSLARAFSERPLVVDGELVVLDEQGRPSFGALQERLDRFGRSAPPRASVTFVVFDLLYGHGRDLRAEPLAVRKAALETILTGDGPVMLSKHVTGDGKRLYALAKSGGLEGIVAKKRSSPYRSRRSRDWLKIKILSRQEFVIGGWTEGRGSRKHFGALLVGTYDGDEFVYAGSVGTGFDEKKLIAIAQQLAPLERKTSPFALKPKTETRAHWTSPSLVAEVSFTEWTRDGQLRHPVFVALRADKDAHEVVREGPQARAEAAGVSARAKETLELGGHTLALSNRDKVLWPQDGYTKGDLVAYYRSIAPFLLPHLTGRPLTLQRYPDGIGGESFFEKNASRFLPGWVSTVEVESEFGRHGSVRFILCNDEATLVYVANLAAIVLHVWTSRVESLDAPEFVFFDLDPHDGCTLATLAKTALALRAALGEIGLAAHVKSSGGSGLHVVIPLAPDYSYDACKAFAELTARKLHDRLPVTTTLERSPAKRPLGTVYLDYVQVGRGKTLVAPYSARARAGAPVSMPLDWAEVEAMARKRAKDTEGEFARFTLKNARARLAELGDLWSGARWHRQRLEPALEQARTVWQ